MLNISPNRINDKIEVGKYQSLKSLEEGPHGRKAIRVLGVISIVALGLMFLPWTQNIRSQGMLTTLRPDQKPQTIHSVIPGRIEKWYVMEGQYVEPGDTIMQLSEVKDAYFDPELLERTLEQIGSKKQSIQSYKNKASAIDRKIEALRESAELKFEQAMNKLEQARLKVASDSMELEAARINFRIAEDRYTRMEDLASDGLRSLTDLESRNMNLQKARADLVSWENKLLSSRNEVINAQVELSAIRAGYRDEIAKAESERFSAESSVFDSEAEYSKLRNQYGNYSVRNDLYFIKAPQAGYITRTLQSGIGETIKEGDELVSIMPASYDLAVEMFVEPMDMPLLGKDQEVRIQFDGWPAIVFSGWPNTSYGTYGGRIFAMDNFISPNGKYRILVIPDTETQPWPMELRVGAGTSSLILLKEVPIWYELWRKLNGFPPDYYKMEGKENSK